MANVKITERDGRIFEVSEISFDEVRELVRPNGNGYAKPPAKAPKHSDGGMFSVDRKPQYTKFKQALSGHTKKFIEILHQSTNGISGDMLAEKLGFKSTNQIGGVTGGGIGKLAPKFNIKLDTIYTKEVTRQNGSRVVIYKPGPDIEKVV